MSYIVVAIANAPEAIAISAIIFFIVGWIRRRDLLDMDGLNWYEYQKKLLKRQEQELWILAFFGVLGIMTTVYKWFFV